MHRRIAKQWWHYSTHLGHPGVFPAAVLMTGQVAAKVYSKASNLITGSPAPVAYLTASRLANALFSSLLPCLIFLFLLPWTSRSVAFCVGLLLALGPRMIDLSTIAHIDVIFAVVTTTTIMSYLAALRWRSAGLKLVAGFLFGLCILSKPTAIALIPAFMLAKTILRYRWPDTYKEFPIAWSDVWSALVGLTVFVGGYTRIWYHARPYPEWVGIDRTIPTFLYTMGRDLQSGLPALALITTVVVIAFILGRKLYNRIPLTGIDHLVGLGAVVTSAWALMPPAFENLTVYYMRVFALTGAVHRSFHGSVPPVPGGYFTLALVDIPPVVVLSTLLMPLLFIPRVRRTLTESEQQLWIMASCAAFIWILFLSTSSKQAWRYAIPVAPQIYSIGTLSLCAVGRFIGTPRLPFVLLILGQVKAVYRGYPYWDLYQSIFAPPPQLSYQIGAFHPRTGQIEAVQFLGEQSRQQAKKIYVTVFGDGKTLTSEADRWLGDRAHHLYFGYYREDRADYVLVQGNIKIRDVVFEKYLASQPVYVARPKGVPLITIYAVKREAVAASTHEVPSSTTVEDRNPNSPAPDLEQFVAPAKIPTGMY
ncbi:MAG: Dolichyl-phosphate-mannose-protein mannosyltransferase [Pseudomonadota bacterium]